MTGDDITFVTLTIPGREQMLARCVESVNAQIVAPYAHLILSDRRGKRDVGAAYNEITDAVLTPWVHFLDDDNYLLPHHLETILPALDDSDVVYTFETSGTRPRVDVAEWSYDERVAAFERENFVDNSCAVRTDVFRQVGGFYELESAPKDWMLMQQLARAGARFRCIPEETWTYQQYEYGGQVLDAREIRKLAGHVDGQPL